MELSTQEMRVLNEILHYLPSDITSKFRISDIAYEKIPYSDNRLSALDIINSGKVTKSELGHMSLKLHKELLRNEFVVFVEQGSPIARSISTPLVYLNEKGLTLKNSGSYEAYRNTIAGKIDDIQKTQKRQINWMVIFAAITTVATIVQAWNSALEHQLNSRKEVKEAQQYSKDSTIQSLQILLDKEILLDHSDTTCVRIVQ